MTSKTAPWEARAELSILSIYREHNHEAEGPLPLWDLEQRWADYGVRFTDLPTALGRLSDRRVINWQDDGNAIELTPSGAQWYSALPGALEYELVVMRRRQAESARRSGAGSRRAIRRRRADPRQTVNA